MPERLIVLTAQDAVDELAELQQRYRVTAALPPRLALLDLDDTELARVAARAGIQTVAGSPSDALLASLTPTEQLFVRAWLLRQQMVDKQRPGEGKAWDTPPYCAPDWPK